MYKLLNVTKSYGKATNQLTILKNVNLSFPNCGLVSILGKSGSGKSTLLNLLTGVDSPTSGHIIFLDKDINKFKEKQKKNYQNQLIGVLFQHFNLFDDISALDNVMLPSLIAGESKNTVKKRAEDLFNKYHLSHLMHQTYQTLSGGEKQRVALLRALINNPKVIIADEPTGALDSKNAILIMDELKALANNHLVIVVTHNEALIKKYEDYRIEIKDGKASPIEAKNEKIKLVTSGSKRINHQVSLSFIKRHLKAHKIRNIIASSSIAFSALCLLLSFGYINGSSQSIDSYKKQSLLYPYATISKKTMVEVPDSPIVISKLTRPDIDELNFLVEKIPSVQIANNYQAVFPECPSFYFDNKLIDDVSFSGIYNFTNYQNLFVAGKPPQENKFSQVVVNEEFVRHFNYQNNKIINHTFDLSFTSEMNNASSDGKTVKDKIEFIQELKIAGVVKEFAYLNSPRIYYSYQGLTDILSNYVLLNYSSLIGENVTVEEIITNADENDANSSYSYNLFIDSLNEVDELFSFKRQYDANGEYDITSLSYTVADSYSSMTNIISTSLIAFIIIALIGTIFIIAITSYSNFTQNKKESAILSILGTQKYAIFQIFNIENLLVGLTGLVVAVILSFPAGVLVNKIIECQFRLVNLIQIPFLSYLPILMILSVILIASLATAIPFLFYENGFIVDELKDE